MPPSPVRTAATEVAVIGGGCFWCLDAVFRELAGVLDVESGYAGGPGSNPSYEDVCTGRSGHAEVIRVVFDPALISYRDLLRVFFTIHDPTTRNRQGNDIGPQYRSVIFCQTLVQREIAEALVAELDATRLWPGSIVTEIADPAPFHPAEAWHQSYFARNGGQPYCQVVVAPKLAKFRQQWSALRKRGPAEP